MSRSFGIVAAVSIAATASWLSAPAAAAPISSLTGLQDATTSLVETVQYRRDGHRGRRIGGVGLELGAGALIGESLFGATRPYGYYGYEAYDPGYYGQDDVSTPPYAGGDEFAYCQQRFRSYDPASGSYLGFDGLRHPCP